MVTRSDAPVVRRSGNIIHEVVSNFWSLEDVVSAGLPRKDVHTPGVNRTSMVLYLHIYFLNESASEFLASQFHLKLGGQKVSESSHDVCWVITLHLFAEMINDASGVVVYFLTFSTFLNTTRTDSN